MSKKILIVEDSPPVYIVMEHMLEKLGYTYHTATNGKQALDIAESFKPDLVLMDIMMPGSMDGIETAKEMAKMNIPFVYNSAYTDDAIVKRAKATNPLGYLVKPLRLENAKIAIEMALYKIEMRKKLAEETRQREHAMAELKKLNEELRHFTFGASHDFQEPLRTIRCFSELILTKYDSNNHDEIPELTQYIINAAKRMENLIGSLLSYSGLSFKSKPFEWCNSNDIIQNAISNLDSLIHQKKALIHCDDDLPDIRGDKNQLIVLFQNLLSNGVKYCTDTQPMIRISKETGDDKWIFSIKDNGIGIDPKYKEYIFKLFKRLHPQQEFSGSGIGLAICEKIVSRHGGTIWFSSQPNEGTTFYFSLSKKLENQDATVN